jgi:hypothetical protein
MRIAYGGWETEEEAGSLLVHYADLGVCLLEYIRNQ